jgi:hypothetical protein
MLFSGSVMTLFSPAWLNRTLAYLAPLARDHPDHLNDYYGLVYGSYADRIYSGSKINELLCSPPLTGILSRYKQHQSMSKSQKGKPAEQPQNKEKSIFSRIASVFW